MPRPEAVRARRLRRRAPAVVVALVLMTAAGIGVGSARSVAPTRMASWHAPTPLGYTPSGTGRPRVASTRLPTFGPGRPVEDDDVGDPFVLPVPAGSGSSQRVRYVLFWTTDWQSNVPTAVSEDLVHWHRVADSLPVLPSWAVDSRTMTWAPAAQRVAGGWVLYFSTEDALEHRECIGAAFALDPLGPYVDRSRRPLVCQRTLGGSIDPSVVRTPSGTSVLVWKSDGNAARRPVGIWAQALTASGLGLVGARHRLIGAGQAWEHGNVEGPALLADTHGGWWLFYAGGSWESASYDTGVAWCATPVGPCRAAPGPILSGTPTAVSPGGLDTFVDAHGRLWASYSVFPQRPADMRSAMAENRILTIAPVLYH